MQEWYVLIQPVVQNEVGQLISSMKRRKFGDTDGLTSNHVQYGGIAIIITGYHWYMWVDWISAYHPSKLSKTGYIPGFFFYVSICVLFLPFIIHKGKVWIQHYLTI